MTRSTSAVTIVADVPSPYQNVLFQAIAERGEVDVEVLYCRRTAPARDAWLSLPPPGVRHRFLAPFGPRNAPTNPALVPLLLRQPDRIPFVIGYYLPSMLAAAAALSAARRRWIFWIDALPPPSLESNGLKSPIRRLGRAVALRNATLCLGTGTVGARSLLRHGVPADRVASLPFVVDSHWIESAVAEARRHRDATRRAMNLRPTDRVLLYVGQLIGRKGVDVVLRSLAGLRNAEQQVTSLALVLVGDGSDRDQLHELAAQLGVQDQVRFVAGMPNGRLAPYWAAADGFILPSRFDAWGTVVVEACAASLPVLGSDACGAVHDIVDHRSNGWVFPAGDVEALTECLREFVEVLPDRLAAMGRCARQSIAPLDSELVAAEFADVVDRASRLPRRS